MRTQIAWTDKIPDKDGLKPAVNDIAYKPDGTQVVAAVGNKVLVYDAVSGDLVHSLKGHKDTVYCVAYAKDGKRFASGGADKTVIIWTSKAEGILKYQHSDSIQCLAYNPVTHQLASATASDFGLWSAEQKSVSKHKVSSKILCCCWTNDGQHLALGHLNGVISIRDRAGEEKVTIKRAAPIWCMAWNPSKDEPVDILAVGCWDQTLSFYQLSGRQVGKDKQLGFDPCSIGYFTNGEYICIGGSDRKVSLWTKEGVRLTNIAEREDWVWCVRQRPKQNYVTVGCNDGSVSTYQLIFSTVHGLYQDQYAYRDFMTDVIVQHLITEKKLRIKCRQYVKKIAIYKDRLAVQLPEKVMVYDLYYDDNGEMQYKLHDEIVRKLDCNLLVVTSLHIILCLEKKLQLFDFEGKKVREWVLESVIRYIKVVGGPVGKEGLLVGLKNGLVLKIFVDNPFPVNLVKLDSSVRCLDLSASRTKLAVVDENTNCLVYNLKTKELLFKEGSANSVAWNTEHEDMLCFSGNGMLNIKTGLFPTAQQKLQGFVVGFKGSKIFCLHYVAMNTIDVPQSASLYRYLEKKDYEAAYKIACLGVTESDWRLLAMQALAGLSFDIARKSFIRVRDVRYIELLNKFENEKKQPNCDEQLFLAEIYAYQGRYQEAAKIFLKAGHVERAIDMFSDLRQWDEAKQFAATNESVNIKDLIRRQAQWAEEVNDAKAAAEMYVAAGDHMKAIQIMGEKGWLDNLAEVCRSLPKTETRAISTCASYFRKNGHHQYAKEAYLKINDVSSLMSLHVELQKWEDAFLLLESNPEYGSDVYLPYAEWLVVNDRFDEAQEAFKKADRPKEALRMIEQLSHNAVLENRFADASFYFWQLASENLKLVVHTGPEMTADDMRCLKRFYDFYEKAELYYAYSFIHKFMELPFTSMDIVNLFNMARFLLVRLATGEIPYGISKMYILFSLAKIGKQIGTYKLARYAYDRLAGLRIPATLMDQVDLASIAIRSKPFSDKEDFMPVCFRCSASNPLVSTQGDVCASCHAPFERSFYSFDLLPLVEFVLDDDISDEEVPKLLGSKAQARARRPPAGNGPDGWRERSDGNVQTLTFDEQDLGDMDASDDPFSRHLMSMEGGERGLPVRVNRDLLRTMRPEEVFIKKWSTPALRKQYYRSMVPEVAVALCSSCNHFFHEEDLEFELLKKKVCPFCRAAPKP